MNQTILMVKERREEETWVFPKWSRRMEGPEQECKGNDRQTGQDQFRDGKNKLRVLDTYIQ